MFCILMKMNAAADVANSVMSVMFTADQDVKTFESMKSAEIKVVCEYQQSLTNRKAWKYCMIASSLKSVETATRL